MTSTERIQSTVLSLVETLNINGNMKEEYEKLAQEEEAVNLRLESLFKRQCHIEGKLRGMTKVLPNLQIVHSDAQQLAEMITFTSTLAENVSAKVRQLDIARSRASDCQQRVHDLLDLQLCAEGVKASLHSEDYEKAAAHVHRFLAMDQHLLEQTADIAEDCTNVTNSFSLLQDAASQLRSVVNLRFDEAVRAEDLASVERFFKLFPLLGLHDEGLEKFSNYLSTKIADTANGNLKTALSTQASDRRANIIFADTLTLLFEGIARIIEIHQPLIETYYDFSEFSLHVGVNFTGFLFLTALGYNTDISAHVQKLRRIVAEMQRCRRLEALAQAGEGEEPQEGVGVGVGAGAGAEVRQLDPALGELAIAHARYALFERFLRRRLAADADAGAATDADRRARLLEVDAALARGDTCRRMQELLSTYLGLERLFMVQSVRKAIALDALDDAGGAGGLCSSAVDDVFFILRKCIRRAASSGSLDGTCAVINNAGALLEEELCSALRARLRQGYPSGYLDLTQAYNSVLAGRLQPTDSEQQRVLFLAALNNADSASEYVETLVKQVSDEIPVSTPMERSKLDSCLHGLSSSTSGIKSVLDYGIQQLRASAVKPRVGPWVDSFQSVSHQLSEDEFTAYEADQPFVQTLVRNLHGLLENFKESLTPGNYDTLVTILTEEVTIHLEKAVFKTSFNRLGGLVLDKEVRALASFLTSSTSWSVRDKFARLTQMATLLNLEKVTEISDYWGSSTGPLTWRLTPSEIRQVLALRVDFRSDDIKRLKL
ncbi:Conserved oligomeric Golgi complex subunit 4 [Gryllus bimaculatus]|nr:Conserved oligomeric Golgi complex subunit 4 [Gryllus bimaculatus]